MHFKYSQIKQKPSLGPAAFLIEQQTYFYATKFDHFRHGKFKSKIDCDKKQLKGELANLHRI